MKTIVIYAGLTAWAALALLNQATAALGL